MKKIIENFKEALESVVIDYTSSYNESKERLLVVDLESLKSAGFEPEYKIPLTEFVDYKIREMLNKYQMQYIHDRSNSECITLYYMQPSLKTYKDVNGNEETYECEHFYEAGEPKERLIRIVDRK